MGAPLPITTNEQLVRARALIASSRESIARSRNCIKDSRLIIERPGPDFNFPGVELTDVQRGALLDRQQAYIEQREIERQVRLTLKEQCLGEAA